jgi:1-acyl-sn-glycerol-3-phosphate acyltransferase
MLVFGFCFWLLRRKVFKERILVKGWKRGKFNPQGKGVLVISNHPSLCEPLLLPLLQFPAFLSSLRLLPFSTPDKKNYYDKWWFYPFRRACIPIDRGNKKEELIAIKERILPHLRRKGILILFPEAGRTFTAKKKRGSKISPNGKEIARFPQGIKRLFRDSDFDIVLVWTEGGEKIIPKRDGQRGMVTVPRLYNQVKINIAKERINSRDISKEEAIEYLEDKLLELGDKT